MGDLLLFVKLNEDYCIIRLCHTKFYQGVFTGMSIYAVIIFNPPSSILAQNLW